MASLKKKFVNFVMGGFYSGATNQLSEAEKNEFGKLHKCVYYITNKPDGDTLECTFEKILPSKVPLTKAEVKKLMTIVPRKIDADKMEYCIAEMNFLEGHIFVVIKYIDREEKEELMFEGSPLVKK